VTPLSRSALPSHRTASCGCRRADHEQKQGPRDGRPRLDPPPPNDRRRPTDRLKRRRAPGDGASARRSAQQRYANRHSDYASQQSGRTSRVPQRSQVDYLLPNSISSTGHVNASKRRDSSKTYIVKEFIADTFGSCRVTLEIKTREIGKLIDFVLSMHC